MMIKKTKWRGNNVCYLRGVDQGQQKAAFNCIK